MHSFNITISFKVACFEHFGHNDIQLILFNTIYIIHYCTYASSSCNVYNQQNTFPPIFISWFQHIIINLTIKQSSNKTSYSQSILEGKHNIKKKDLYTYSVLVKMATLLEETMEKPYGEPIIYHHCQKIHMVIKTILSH